MNWSNFAEFFISSMSLYGKRNAIFWRKNGNNNPGLNNHFSTHSVNLYDSITGTKLKELVYHIAKTIEGWNLKPGDKAAIISESRFEWVVADFACIMNSVETIPIYTTMTSSQMKYILEHSGAKICFTSTRLITDKVKAVFDELPNLTKLISFNNLGSEHDYVINFEDLIYSALIHAKESYDEKEADNYFESCAAKINYNDILTIIYTSGTTGVPKGVCLTHRNVLSNIEMCQKAFHISSEDRFLSFLPLAHSYERTTGYYFAVSVGAEIYYGENIDTLASQFTEVQPTLVTAVPILFNRVYSKIIKSIQSYPSRKRMLVNYAFKLAMKSGTEHGSTLWKFFDKIVYKKIRERTGGKINIFISGGSALNPDINRFFNGIGLNVYEGYGLTEASPVIAVNRPGKNKIGSVGLFLDGIEPMIAEDGEILIRGENVMKGYFKEEGETQNTIIDGWLHTGDIGEIDNEGYLKITDRKKTLIKTAGGKYISLTHVEETIGISDYVSQIICFAGDDKAFVSALIVPDFELLTQYVRSKNIEFSGITDLVKKPEIIKLIENEISRCQHDHAKYERVRKFVLLDHEFTIDTGEMTPTLKLKRKVIERKYKDLIGGMYKL